ncbi:MAG: iron-sulfur cluster assembly accessory protein [Candidatus Jidaibacter sp.]|jgi:iron-sulfur cluster insertion protein|nr:iron-sulfur cluster assembly accessory protein [Candidatus Jidaibacter sp.]
MPISITKAAAKRILELTGAGKNTGFRISVLGGGCSGFQYEFDYMATKEEGDEIFLQDGAIVYVDRSSLEFLSDCSLDYIEDLGSAKFEIKNPNATAKCGCGNSFAV